MKKVITAIVIIALIAVVGIGAGYYFTHKNSAAGTASTTISEAEAQTAALEDAGLTEADVRFTKIQLDRDDGRQQYDLEFIASADNTKYDYEIDAATGAIISSNKEQGNAPQATGASDSTVAQPQANGEITGDEAKVIALNHAGVAEADALYMDVNYEHDDGRAEWSVNFSTQDTEYDYEIAAADGNIISSEKEAAGR